MKQLAVFPLVVLALVLLLSCGGGTEVEEWAVGLPSGPHPVVIIAIDGLRADALGAYGAPTATPAFDALAAESVRFDWAFAQAPEMVPSLASVVSAFIRRPTVCGPRETFSMPTPSPWRRASGAPVAPLWRLSREFRVGPITDSPRALTHTRS